MAAGIRKGNVSPVMWLVRNWSGKVSLGGGECREGKTRRGETAFCTTSQFPDGDRQNRRLGPTLRKEERICHQRPAPPDVRGLERKSTRGKKILSSSSESRLMPGLKRGFGDTRTAEIAGKGGVGGGLFGHNPPCTVGGAKGNGAD